MLLKPTGNNILFMNIIKQNEEKNLKTCDTLTMLDDSSIKNDMKKFIQVFLALYSFNMLMTD